MPLRPEASHPLSKVRESEGEMWLFTVEGFLSVVEHRGDKHKVMVRARNRTALEPLAAAAHLEITETPAADYPFRITVDKDQMASWAAQLVRAIDYANFKDAAHDLGDPRYDRALMQVWNAMYESSPDDARSSR